MATPSDLNDATPTSPAHLVGQPGVVEQVRVALDAAHQDGRPFDHALLVGPPGCGKTQTAEVVAAEMAATFHEVLGQSITGPADLNALLLGTRDRDVVLIDEAHELDKEFQTALYLALDQRRVLLNAKSARGPQALPLADFTLLLATTDEFRLLQPLRDRMRLILRFEFYDPDDLATLVRQRCRALAWPVGEAVLPEIARRSRGTPRLALRLLQACRRVCRAEGEQAVTADHLDRACALEGIDALGLGPVERAYLRVVAAVAVRLNVIASRLGLPAKTVSEVVEPFLIRSGVVAKDDQGRRELTAEGRAYLSSGRPAGV
jgi:Holliday junction DNA helicase RuvB